MSSIANDSLKTKDMTMFVPLRRDRNINAEVAMISALLLSLGVTVSQCMADVGQPEDHGRFDGSAFGRSGFRDDEFDKHTFRDIDTQSAHPLKKAEEAVVVRPGEAGAEKRKAKGVEAVGGEIRESAGTGVYSKEFAQTFAPIHELTGDWVPDQINLPSNGGFGIAPFSGSPVPYTLNGHVDPNRGKPWEEHD
ncbi:MAG TPA: hypothetical protein V6C69_21625 [Trichormus sp.]